MATLACQYCQPLNGPLGSVAPVSCAAGVKDGPPDTPVGPGAAVETQLFIPAPLVAQAPPPLLLSPVEEEYRTPYGPATGALVAIVSSGTIGPR